MSKIITDMSMSLDGFIAGTEGDQLHGWLFGGTIEAVVGGATFHVTSEASAQLFKAFIERAGAAVIGKNSYVAIQEQAPFQLPTFVLTHQAQESTSKNGTPVTFVEGLENALAQAKMAANGKDVYIFGGANVLQQCLRAGLLDELRIDLVPILLGKGIHLFDQLEPTVELESMQAMAGVGVTHLVYRVIR